MGRLMFRLGVKIQGQPLLSLTTVGARSGKRRRTVVGWFADDQRPGSFLIVASNAGSARHPGWAYNLAASPDRAMVDLGEGEFAVDADVLSGEARESAWEKVVDLAPGYGSYLDKTDREIPIFRLTPRS